MSLCRRIPASSAAVPGQLRTRVVKQQRTLGRKRNCAIRASCSWSVRRLPFSVAVVRVLGPLLLLLSGVGEFARRSRVERIEWRGDVVVPLSLSAPSSSSRGAITSGCKENLPRGVSVGETETNFRALLRDLKNQILFFSVSFDLICCGVAVSAKRSEPTRNRCTRQLRRGTPYRCVRDVWCCDGQKGVCVRPSNSHAPDSQRPQT